MRNWLSIGLTFCLIFYQSVCYAQGSQIITSVDVSGDSIHMNLHLGTRELVSVESGTLVLKYEEENIQWVNATGEPNLPSYIFHVLLPPDVDLNSVGCQLEQSDYQPLPELNGYRVQPVPPPVTWIDGKMIVVWPEGRTIRNGQDVAIYESDEFWPDKEAEIESLSALRTWQIARIALPLIRYNPVADITEQFCSGRISVTYSLNARSLSVPEKQDNIGIGRVIDLCVNFEEMMHEYEVPEGLVKSMDTGGPGYAIITTQAIVNNSLELQHFIQHKNSRGFNVIMVTEQDFGFEVGNAAAENIRAWLQANYLGMGIEYVLLIGNPIYSGGDIPMKELWTRDDDLFAPITTTDFYFADLTGNWDLDGDGIFGEPDDFGTGGIDFAAEVMVGRIPVYSASAAGILDSILRKIIAYELNDSIDNLRRTCLLSINPVDEETEIHLLGEAIKDDILIPADWSYHRIYEEEYGLEPPPESIPTNFENVAGVWSRRPFGFSIYAAHGSSGTAQDIINVNYVDRLNDDYPSMTFQASCTNSYPIVENNLSYKLLQNGAVSTLGATSIAYYIAGETSFANSPSTNGMAYEYARRLVAEGMTQGEALFEVDMILPNNQWWNKTVFAIYGDPSLSINGCQAPVPVVNDIVVLPKDSVPAWNVEGTDLRWYSDPYLRNLAATGGELQATDKTPGDHHYYVTQTIDGCESAPEEATLTILLPPTPILLSKDTSVYMDEQIPLLVALGDSIKWYTDYTLSNLVFIGNVYITGKTLPGVYTYFVTQTYYGVESEPEMLTLRILVSPPKAGDITVLYGEGIPVLEATGENIKWYTEFDLENTIIDKRDNRQYATVKIGSQNWMAENLNYATLEGSWSYNDDDSLREVYGRLYDWNTAMEVCPAGWKLPGDNDWKELETFIGMDTSVLDSYGERGTDEGGKLKAPGFEFWDPPNEGAINTYGFNARGAGCYWGASYYLHSGAYFWTSSTGEYDYGILRDLRKRDAAIERSQDNKSGGLSVRCIQESPVPVAQGNIFQPDVTPGTYIYYVTQTVNGTESEPDTLVLTVLLNPPEAENVSVCSGEQPVLRAEGENIKWYDISFDHYTDKRDGQLYETTLIDRQIWMAENLNYYTSSGSRYYKDDSLSYADPYGRLYDWETASNVCPDGWKLPGDEEWMGLEFVLGMDPVELYMSGARGTDEGGMLKSTGFDYWLPPNEGATNAYGFNAVGAGDIDLDGDFYRLKSRTVFWTSTPTDEYHAVMRYLSNTDSQIGRKTDGYTGYTRSVRCMREKPEPIATGNVFIPDTAKAGKYIYYATQTVNGIESGADSVVLTIHPGPEIPIAADYAICEGLDPVTLTAAGEHIKWYADFDTLPLVDERDGQEYLTVKIGKQWWMAENLNYGNRIDSKNNPANNGQAEKYCYSDMHAMCGDYGGLYTWNEAMNYSVLEADRGICPAGWHIPSDREWRMLELHLGMDTAETFHTDWRGTLEGGKLKDNSLLYWVSPNSGATDEAGFTAVPAGTRYLDYQYHNLGSWAYFWTSTLNNSGNAWKRNLTSFESRIKRQSASVNEAMSVRCVKDNPVVNEGDTLILDNPKAGIYTYNVSQTVNGCESDYQTIELTIHPVPGLPGAEDRSVCQGEPIPDLSATGDHINWYADSVLTNWLETGNSYSTEQTEAGSYTYFVTQTALNCESSARPVTLQIHPLPFVDLGHDTTIFSNENIRLDASGSAYSYEWSNGSDLPYLDISGSETGTGTHLYWVTVTDTHACSNSDSIRITVVEPSGSGGMNAGNPVKIYPNPARDILLVQLTNSGGEEFMLTVFDCVGKEVIAQSFSTIGHHLLEIDVSNLSSGYYIIKIIGNRFSYSKGLVVE